MTVGLQVLALAGLICVIYGCYLWFAPLAWIMAGFLTFTYAELSLLGLMRYRLPGDEA